MHEVNESNENMLAGLKLVEQRIQKGDINGVVIVMRARDGSQSHYFYPGDVNPFEWVGGMEMLKQRIMDDMDVEEPVYH